MHHVSICLFLACMWLVGWMGYIYTKMWQLLLELGVLISRCLTFLGTLFTLFKVPRYKFSFLSFGIQLSSFLTRLDFAEITVRDLGAWFMTMQCYRLECELS